MEKLLQEFTFGNQNKVLAKLKHFQEIGISQLHVILDFDRTLTTRKSASIPDVTTWQVLRMHLPPEGNDEYVAMWSIYRAKELNNTLTQADAIYWWEETLKLFSTYKLSLKTVENDFFSKVSIRPETKELFDLFYSYHIPSVVISAGVKDIITMWCNYYGVTPGVVISTKLETNFEGTITGWDKKSLVHILNKKEQGHKELTRIRTTRPLTLLIGDGINDAHIVEGEENVLRIRINDPREDEKVDREKLVHDTFETFDLMIEKGTFQPVIDLIEFLAK